MTSFSFLSYSSSKLDDLPPFGVSAGDEFSYGVTTPYLPSLTRSFSRNSANRSIFFRSTTEAMMLEGSNGVGDDDEEGRFLGGPVYDLFIFANFFNLLGAPRPTSRKNIYFLCFLIFLIFWSSLQTIRSDFSFF